VIPGDLEATFSGPVDVRDYVDSSDPNDIPTAIKNPDIGGLFYFRGSGCYYIITELSEDKSTVTGYKLWAGQESVREIKVDGDVCSADSDGAASISSPATMITKSQQERKKYARNMTQEKGVTYESGKAAYTAASFTSSDNTSAFVKFRDKYLGWRQTYDSTGFPVDTSFQCVTYALSESGGMSEVTVAIETYTGSYMDSTGSWQTRGTDSPYTSYLVKLDPSDWVYYESGSSSRTGKQHLLWFSESREFLGGSDYNYDGPIWNYGPSERPEGAEYVAFGMYSASIAKVYSHGCMSKKILDQAEEIETRYNTLAHKEVAHWSTSKTTPYASLSVGNRRICDKEGIFLVHVYQDTAAQNKVEIIGELQGNNLFRFKSGGYAPVVVIGDSDYAATEVDLYTDAACTTLAYRAGKFDPLDWWETKCGKTEKPLYNSSGEEVYVRKPWETKDLGYDIVTGWLEPFWMIGGEFDSGKGKQSGNSYDNTIFGFFEGPCYYRGIMGKEVEPTGYALDLPTSYNGLRCIYVKGQNGGSSGYRAGLGGLGSQVSKAGGYPQCDVSQITCMTKARARNIGNTTSNWPVCEGMGFHKLSHIYARYLRYLRYDLHQDSLWGPGLSCNIAPSSGTWDLCKGGTGVKWSTNGGGTWNYQGWSTYPSLTWSSGSGSTDAWFGWVSNWSCLGRCLESQMALSYAVECGIGPEEEFTWDGFKYKYACIPGCHTLLEGPTLNARLYSWRDFSVTAYAKSSTTALTLQGQVKYEWPVCDGMVLWGDVFDYGWAGLECVVDIQTPTSGKHVYTNPYTLYLCTHQKDLVYCSTDVTAAGGVFAFERTYEKIGSGIRNGEGWSGKLHPYSIVPVGRGGGTMYTGTCSYQTNYDYSGWFSNTGCHKRAALRGRGSANWSAASARNWAGDASASYSNRFFSASVQIALA
jgi:hypothetical protein